MVFDGNYIFPCKNNGKCRQLMFEEYGIEWLPTFRKFGIVQVETPSKHGDWSNRVAEFKCCTQCHLPINQAEATRINSLLGVSLQTIEIDDDFLELLNDL